MTSPEQSNRTIAPGWYPDPQIAATQRYWDGAAWTEHRAPMVSAPIVVGKAYKTSHGFHLVMTILTMGLWGLFVWLPIGIYNASKNGH